MGAYGKYTGVAPYPDDARLIDLDALAEPVAEVA